MKQPELGNLVASTRSKRNITQEELAESCDVSVRTIQRIENGTVMPHAYTLRALSETLEIGVDANGKAENNLWIVLAHLSSIGLLVPVPLIMWALTRGNDVLAESHARKALNYQLTMTLALLAWFGALSVIAVIMGVGNIFGPVSVGLWSALTILPPIALGIHCTWFGILNSVRILQGIEARYPLAISFFK